MNWRKSIVVFVALLLFAVPLFKSSAQVSSSGSAMSATQIQEMISNLLKQIAELQTQLNAQQSVGTTTSSPTFVNFSAPSCKKLLNNLRYGDKGDNVSVLQDFLKQQGYVISSSEDSDNRFGSSTASAVSSFQQKYSGEILTPANLTRPNSFVGQRTRDKINSLLCSEVTIPAPVVPVTTPDVTTVSDPVISELGVTSSSINSGESTVLFWNTSNATKLTMDYGGSINFLTVPGGKMSVSPARTTTFVVTASNSQGKMAAKSVTVTVNVTPAVATTTTVATPVPACPTVTSPANSASYTVGQDPVFTWGATTGRNTYMVDLTTDRNFSWWWNNGTGTGGGSSALSANFSSIKNGYYATYYGKDGGPVVPATGTTYYWRVYAYNSATNQGCHSEIRSFKFIPVPVVYVPEPSISSFTASASTITSGAQVTLSWNTLNTSKLTMDYQGSILDLAIPSGTKVVSPTQTTTYVITASNSQGKMSAKSVTVNVTQPVPVVVPAATVNLTASASSVVAGSPVTLSWTSTNAVSLTMDYQGSIISLPASGTKVVNPAITTRYIINAQNSAGAFAAGGVTVTVTQPVPVVVPAATVNLTASASSVVSGSPVTLSWTSTNATSLTMDNGLTYLASSGSKVVNPTVTTTYSIRVQNSAGAIVMGSVTVNVTQPVPVVVPAATVNLTASASSVVAGSPVTLSWTSTNASQITMDYQGSILTLAKPSGTKVVNPTVTTTYIVKAQNSAGAFVASSVTVNVTQPVPTPVPAATVNLTASASSVVSGSPVTLSWTSTNATSLTMDNGLTYLASSGSKVVNPTVTTTYSIRVQNSAGAIVMGSVTVNVTQPVVVAPVAACPVVTSPANGASYTVGQDINFSWGATAGRNTYIVDLTTDPNFAWQWNSGSGPAGGTSSLSANLSSIRNSYYAGGRLAPAGVLEAGKTYYWRVYAYDSATNQGCHSEVRSFSSVGSPVNATVGAPGLYSPANGATILAGSNPTFSWSTGNYSTYIMDLTTDPNFSWQWNSGSGAIGGSSATSVTFSGIKNTTYSNGNPVPSSLEAGKTYYWRVYGYNPANPGAGAHSAIYMFKVANMVATQSNHNTDQLANIYSSLQMIMEALKGLAR